MFFKLNVCNQTKKSYLLKACLCFHVYMCVSMLFECLNKNQYCNEKVYCIDINDDECMISLNKVKVKKHIYWKHNHLKVKISFKNLIQCK